jgi:pyruvate/2-oxoglutarate dehydrogenase complex dihydrolipoamide acyltransferase (E2) component
MCRYLVADGTHVEQDQPYAEMEAMKQVMLLSAPAAGRISFHISENCSLSSGDVVASLVLDDPDSVSKGRPFTGTWPRLAQPQVQSDGIQHLYKDAMGAVDMILAGFTGDVDTALHDLFDVLESAELPFVLWDEQWGAARLLLPDEAAQHVDSIVTRARRGNGSGHVQAAAAGAQNSAAPGDFPAEDVHSALEECILSAPVSEQRIIESAIARARELVSQLQDGPGALARHVAHTIITKFLDSEQPFIGAASEQDATAALRQEHACNLQHVLDVLLSHQALPEKAQLVRGVLDAIVAAQPQPFRHALRRLATLPARAPLTRVVQRAQQMLETSLLTQLSAEIAAALVPPSENGTEGEESQASSASLAGATGGRLPHNSSLASLTGGQRVLSQAVSKLADELQSLGSLDEKCVTLAVSVLSGCPLNQQKGSRHQLLQAMVRLLQVRRTFAGLQVAMLRVTCRLALLVSAPAAVEEAVALLLCSPGPKLRNLACLAYIRRLYSPYLLSGPRLLVCSTPSYRWTFSASISSGANWFHTSWSHSGCQRCLHAHAISVCMQLQARS